MSVKKNLLDYDLPTLKEIVIAAGFPQYRATQLINWIHQKFCLEIDQMSNLDKRFKSWLKEHFEIRFLNKCYRYDSVDGTKKWIFNTLQGNIETVYIPHDGRGTLCVSSQVGCALACQFCATGAQGFTRNLSCSEIISQLWLVISELKTDQIHRPVSNVVFMGMGEPLMNEKHVFKAVNLMLEDHAYGLSKYKVTVSTVGIVPAMYRLYDLTGASIAVSLHAPNQQLRDEIVPINRKYPLKDLIQACHDYVNQSKRSITFEYTMIRGKNDSLKAASELTQLLKGLNCKINLIPCNPISGGVYTSTDSAHIKTFQNYLKSKGYCVTIRQTRGDDIAAACGQLAQTATLTGKQIASHPGN
ncbi:MAG: 23S rRNA (adenine(2503)-C(2))-methyltransferase RlmN [Legionellales bacterium]|nr:23S rRNA (adenine(2503)-C(2))-methyltransferase RlmN [Legionellales bacterium]OUX67542.1 MAG: 23S rRNA (adenine(2503)-C(2))-methyltransferase [bacterium TMED178]|tara:strand:- start:5110 stop:6183 length:1074 start_codon:yes stop_codon:yes gene_type:complete